MKKATIFITIFIVYILLYFLFQQFGLSNTLTIMFSIFGSFVAGGFVIKKINNKNSARNN